MWDLPKLKVSYQVLPDLVLPGLTVWLHEIRRFYCKLNHESALILEFSFPKTLNLKFTKLAIANMVGSNLPSHFRDFSYKSFKGQMVCGRFYLKWILSPCAGEGSYITGWINVSVWYYQTQKQITSFFFRKLPLFEMISTKSLESNI